MNAVISSAYGSWSSPISAKTLTQSAKGFAGLGKGTHLWWIETRPEDAGRNVLVELVDGVARDVTRAPFSARSRVHEYGGAAVLAHDDGYFAVNFVDQQIYRVAFSATPKALTATANARFADMCSDHRRHRLIAVCEQQVGAPYPENKLVSVALADGSITDLARGHDFYSNPCISPDGRELAYLAWDDPHMPWDAATLYVCALDSNGVIASTLPVAGSASASVFQPSFLPDGRLVFMFERHGFWNPWIWDGKSARPLLTDRAEYGLPLWGLGTRSYTVIDKDHIVAQRIDNGAASLVRIDLRNGQRQTLASAYQRFAQLCSDHNGLYFIGEQTLAPRAVVHRDFSSDAETVVESSSLEVDAALLSAPERIEFASPDGPTFAWFYAPNNPAHRPLDNEKPPLMVITHGGPTGAASSALNLGIQYWTSRGWAVVDVDYGGSTGYGRAYRERLRKRWGIVDVRDAVLAVDHLIARGAVDANRVSIRGGSAGGFTTLAALTFTQRFRAGASLYGIGDLAALARETHKFEARYTDHLIAPWPEGEAVYRERSPIHAIDRLACPVIFLQGGEDKIVPPNQAEMMRDAIKKKGIPVAYLLFPDEGHGFRKAGNIRRAIEAEYYFFATVFAFKPADDLPAIPIDNLSI